MAGWQNFKALLDAEEKKKLAQPNFTTVSQAAISPLGGPAPVLDPTAAILSQRAPAAAQGPKTRTPAAVSVPGMKNFSQRTAGSEMDAIRALWDRQQGDVDKTRGQADELEAAPQKADLSPLAGLAAAWGGDEGKAAASTYEKPMKAEDRAKMVAQLRNLADDNERGISAERVKLVTGGDKNDTNLFKAMMGIQARQLASSQPNWRTDRLINTAVDSIHKAPNLKTYTDMANSVAEGQYLLSKPGVTVTEANEALTTLTRAIGRTNISSDYRQKQIETKTASELASKLKTFITSNPNQPAPPEVVNLLRKMGGRVLDTYDVSIKREAKRVAQGKRFTQPEVNDAVAEAVDHYGSGRYMQELRDTYNLPKSELGGGHNAPAANLSADDIKAIQYAKDHPKDPASAKILQLHGM